METSADNHSYCLFLKRADPPLGMPCPNPTLWFLDFYSLLPNESRNSVHLSNMHLLFASLLRHVRILQICVSLDFSVCTLDGLIRPAEIIIIINPHYKSKQCSIAPILFSFNPVHVIRHWWPDAEPSSCCHQLAIILSLPHIAVCIIIHVAPVWASST